MAKQGQWQRLSRRSFLLLGIEALLLAILIGAMVSGHIDIAGPPLTPRQGVLIWLGVMAIVTFFLVVAELVDKLIDGVGAYAKNWLAKRSNRS